jgi:hypothetical protein
MHDDVLERLFGDLAGADVPVPAPGSIVARGRQRRRRARARRMTAVVAVAVMVVGVTQFIRNRETPATTGQHTQPAVCAAAPDAALSAELRHALPTSHQQSVSVIALSPNHEMLYLLTTSAAGFHGIAAESVATGAITQELTPKGAPNIYTNAQGGLGPDGDLVSTATYSDADGSGTTTVEVLSPKTGRLIPLEPAEEVSTALSAPVFAGPAHQLVAWEAQWWTGNSFVRQIVEADLLDTVPGGWPGVTDVIATGYVGAPVFVGDALVWPVASSATGPSHLVAVNASAFPARRPVAVPLPLRKAGSATVIVSSGGASAYASADRTKLYYSPAPSQPARQVLRLPSGSHLVPGGLALGRGYLAWNTSAGASFVASARSLAATRITDGTVTWGTVQGLGSDVLASRSGHPKSGPRSLYLLSGSVIDRLTCTAGG